MDNTNNICNFCSKIFSTKVNLIRHQTTTKSCLLLQGKIDTDIECPNCKKKLVSQYFKQHKIKCDQDYSEINKIYSELSNKNKFLEEQNKELKLDLDKLKDVNNELQKLRIELAESKATISILEKHNERLYVSSNNFRVKLEEKQEKTNSD